MAGRCSSSSPACRWARSAAVVLVAGWVLVRPASRSPRSSCPALVALPGGGRAARPGRRGARHALLGTTVRPPVSSPGRAGFWRRGGNVLGDEAFWRQQVVPAAALRARLRPRDRRARARSRPALAAIVEPIGYRWTNQDLGSWHVDTLGRALLFVAPGVLALVLAVVLIRPFGARRALAGRRAARGASLLRIRRRSPYSARCGCGRSPSTRRRSSV